MKAFRLIAALIVLCLALPLVGQQQQQLPDSPTPQPDRPAFPTPNANVPSRPVSPSGAAPGEQPAPSQADPKENPETGPTNPEPAPPSTVKTVPSGSVPRQAPNPLEELPGIIRKDVNFVLVPVTVKDDGGRLISGLTQKNFTIYENSEKQAIKFFTSDPFAISAALVIDVGMPEVALEKIKQTYPAWIGSFSAYDEVSVYTYGNTVRQQQDFVGSQSEKVVSAFKRASEIHGRGAGPADADSPMTSGPSVNGRPADPGTPSPMYRNRMNDEPSRVLNDAVLRAALDLSKRPRERRKMIFIVSDGREQGSTASYADVLKVLLSNEVSVYGIALDASAIPGYNKTAKIRLPRQGYSNILPKFASATGGEVFNDFRQDSIERAYAQVTEQARNQYTIGYTTPVTPSGTYKSIEVRVNQAGLKIYARDGYYPLPPARK